MIVEFIGASGAGKTTLMHAVERRLRNDRSVITAWDMVTGRPGLRRLSNPSARNLAADVVSLVPAMRGWKRHGDFIRFAVRHLWDHADSRFMRLNYTRSIFRRLGMHERAGRMPLDHIILVDEGTVLIAYLLFVYARSTYSQSDLDRFSELVPKPDCVVHVTAPIETLVKRSTERPDRRRELVGDRDDVRQSLERAVAVFDGVASCAAVSDRVLTVVNPACSAAQLSAAADAVGAHLLGSAGGGVGRW